MHPSKLLVEIDNLKEEIRQLKEELEPPGKVGLLMGHLGLTRQESRLTLALVLRGLRSHDQLMTALQREQRGSEPYKDVFAHVAKVRRKLGQHVIQNVQGYGYKMPDKERDRIRQIIE